ncbi:uncharacterized protein isoform X1 [Choristoneura fumiferana]|uniref:uncharacterized protein isoform X1 n=1 Tax=Choristoneura fumiferana TaxID=7141 RepID=UPI003D156B8E
MDFLDFLDLQTNDKKSDRMRSWYLYEQYKSLEKHQLDAAEKLKNRSYQERLLHRELAERRARRRLYQPAPAGLRERPDCARSRDDATHLSTTTIEDFYETFCELHDEFRTADPVSDCEESEPDAELEKAYMENFPCIDGLRNETTCTQSVNSFTEKTATFTKKSLADKLEAVQRNIAENINLQLDTVKENMLCLEKYAMSDGDKTSEEELSVESLERSSGNAEALDKGASVLDNSMFTMWTRMVSFAYQVIQLNHGNCYYDYSSQLMTAVLACDILRRGFNRMCRILQPYVSPIKLCTESDESDECVVTNSYKNAKRKKCLASKKKQEIITADDKF